MDLINLMNSLSVNETEDKSSSVYRLASASVNNIPTDIVLGKFVNRLMVIASQYEKVGSLLRVTIDTPEDNLDISDPVYSVVHLFGAESPEIDAAARYIAERLGRSKSILISFALKDYSAQTVRELAEELVKLV